MDSKTIDINDLQSRLPEFITTVRAGAEIILSDHDQPIARLTPIEPSPKKRIPGLNRGELWMSDDFNEPLPDSFWTGDS